MPKILKLLYEKKGNKMLNFTYGVMGSSKSAQALITRYNYCQKGFNVILIKPSIDNRDDSEVKRTVSSRIGINAQCIVFDKTENLIDLFINNIDRYKHNIVIVDEVQFCTKQQINQLRLLAKDVLVMCYGLKTNYKSELFEGSKRLIEIADNIECIPYICRCGKNALINARMVNGKPIVEGNEIDIGGNEKYEALCFECWNNLLNKK